MNAKAALLAMTFVVSFSVYMAHQQQPSASRGATRHSLREFIGSAPVDDLFRVEAIGAVKSIYPIEKVGVIARSVIFPPILNQGEVILHGRYPNATILCLDVANYAGSVNGLIWSMDRELVEEYGLQELIDQTSVAVVSCVAMFLPLEGLESAADAKSVGHIQLLVAKPGAAIETLAEAEEQAPPVSVEDAQQALAAQIKEIQNTIKFAQTVQK